MSNLSVAISSLALMEEANQKLKFVVSGYTREAFSGREIVFDEEIHNAYVTVREVDNKCLVEVTLGTVESNMTAWELMQTLAEFKSNRDVVFAVNGRYGDDLLALKLALCDHISVQSDRKEFKGGYIALWL